MFTGIIETMATVANIIKEGTNLHFIIESTIIQELKIDQSIAHNGVCLTVNELTENNYKVTAVAETISKTNLAHLKIGSIINLERALKIGDRLDGHFVQGHVDTVAECIYKKVIEGSWLYRFKFPEKFTNLIIEKGSITINGVSLTLFNIGKDEFTVTIIPYTFHNTNFCTLEKGDIVNIEFDVLGKYFLRLYQK